MASTLTSAPPGPSQGRALVAPLDVRHRWGGGAGASPFVFRLDPGAGVPTYLQLVEQVEHAVRRSRAVGQCPRPETGAL